MIKLLGFKKFTMQHDQWDNFFAEDAIDFCQLTEFPT